MENRSFYNEILTEHNLHPEFKHDLPDADIVLEGVNPSCGDDIFLKLKLDGDVIADGAFVGDGCAVSQASADIMLGMIVGKKKEDALKMGEIFLKMIQGEASEDEIDSLEEASALRDIAHMPAGRIHRARGTDTDGPHLVKTLTRRLMRYSDDVFDHGIVAMPGGNTGGTQYRAHCVNQHSFDFCSAHVNTDFEIVHSVFGHQSSPVLHRTFRLISVYI